MTLAPSYYSPTEASDFAAFKSATQGMHPWRVALILNKLNPGVDYRGCTMRDLAKYWAKRKDPHFYLPNSRGWSKLKNQDLRNAISEVVAIK